METRKLISTAMLVTFGFIAMKETNAQNVTISNADFKGELVGNAAINTNGDKEIQVSEASAYKGIIEVHNKGIKDLTGIIAFFPKITGLSCFNNGLTSLDVSKNTALIQLECISQDLTSLDVSKNTALTKLACYNNRQLTSLDVSKNTALTDLDCSSNLLKSLDVSKNTALTKLLCNGNKLTSLDVSKNTALTEFFCSGNNLTSLDVSENTALTDLDCGSNFLTSLNVSNTALIQLECDDNQLTSLDVSKNTALISLNCSRNQLKNLNIKNGNNFKLTIYKDRRRYTGFKATENPNLTCIEVDDEIYMNTSWATTKDSGASFLNTCATKIKK